MNILAIGAALLLGLFGLSRKKKESVPGKTIPSKLEKYFASFPGWRRAKQSEVTPEMTSAALAALKLPLRSVVEKGTYRVAVETHESKLRGVHKGASIFLPIES